MSNKSILVNESYYMETCFVGSTSLKTGVFFITGLSAREANAGYDNMGTKEKNWKPSSGLKTSN